MAFTATLRGRVLVLGVALGALLRTSSAGAQMLAPEPSDVERTRFNISNRENWINREACRDAVFTFTLNPGSFSGRFSLHVWASSGNAQCTDPVAQTAGQCKQVVAPIDARIPMTVRVPARNIVRPASGAFTGDADESVCDEAIDTTKVTLQFFLLDTAQTQYPGVATYGVEYDLIGPDPPTSVRAGVGERALVVRWNERRETDLDLTGYNIYVDPIGSIDPDGGVDPDGGTNGAAGAAGDGECFSETLVPGELAPTDFRTTTGATATQAEVTGLRNGTRYAVAVAAIDAFENPGTLSELACAAPEPVRGFFETYRAAGGGGGGGYCAVGARPSGLAALAVAAAAFGLAIRRRARMAHRANAEGIK